MARGNIFYHICVPCIFIFQLTITLLLRHSYVVWKSLNSLTFVWRATCLFAAMIEALSNGTIFVAYQVRTLDRSIIFLLRSVPEAPYN